MLKELWDISIIEGGRSGFIELVNEMEKVRFASKDAISCYVRARKIKGRKIQSGICILALSYVRYTTVFLSLIYTKN
jgi:hypothetical protein